MKEEDYIQIIQDLLNLSSEKINEKTNEIVTFNPESLDILAEDSKLDGINREDENTFIVNLETFDNITRKIEINNPKNKDIIAIDASSITLGKINDGIISATKGAIVFPDHIETYGPIIFIINNNNIGDIYNHFRKNIFGLSSIQILPNITKMPDRIRNFIERLLQQYALTKVSNALFLWDGSLGVGKNQFDTPEELLNSSINLAQIKNNCIISITKQTTLILENGKNMLSILSGKNGPIMVDVSQKIALFGSRKYKIMGYTFAAKLTDNGLPFRIDLALPDNISPESVLENLIYNSNFHYGYPLSLRNAHIYAKITKDEVLACQKLIATKLNTPIIEIPDIHRILLSPYG